MLLSPKHLPRLVAIVELFTRYGIRDVARQQGLLALASSDDDELPPEKLADIEANAAGFRKKFVELGPAYVKLGQMLSTRSDLLPPPFIRELESLQDDMGQIPPGQIQQTIEKELGARFSGVRDRGGPDSV